MSKMRVCIVGGGARELAIARAVKRSPRCGGILCIAPAKNPAIAELCDEYKIADANKPEEVVAFCTEHKADLAFVGPEAPLNAGVVDALEAAGVGAVGPTKALTKVESSKEYCREVMGRRKVPGIPKYRAFKTAEGLADYATVELKGEYVVKADGLCGGKGVKVSGEHLANTDEALVFCQEIFSKGECAVLEEKFIGEEFSLMSWCDGTHMAHMPPIQDHKRAWVGDTGPNTGGMGSYSCGGADGLLPFMTKKDLEAAQAINVAMAAALKEENNGVGFKGVLYGAYMCTKRGVGCIEFNARFGDPESINLLTLLKSDIIMIMEAVVKGTLSQDLVEMNPLASVVKYAVPFGYPDNPQKGAEIDVSEVDPNSLFLASVDVVEGKLIELGSRTAAVVKTGKTVAAAEAACEKEIRKITGPVFHRPDIGTSDVLDKRVANMEKVRKVRVGVVGSTRGSSLQPILYAIRDGDLNAEISVVVGNVASSYILQRARVNGIPAVHIPGKGRVREEFDQDVTNVLRSYNVDIVLLVGFMRIVSGSFCQAWPGKLINVHPSLLPLHAGLMDLAVHQSVIDAGDKESGCTVHQVIEEVDGGGTVVQLKVPVTATDTAETLKAKVQKLEGAGLIEAIRMYDRDGFLPGGPKGSEGNP
mmetsp:Transcript_1301/g.2837  ORF Transcript_1301/g.2837 Transcript_1301/m.2837 type:complete len:646 (+) Transcript_1301:153-2090(+)